MTQATVASQVQWLVDRAGISDLLFSFAAALDRKDWQTYADNYVDGGCVELPDPASPDSTFVLRKEHMLEKLPKSLGRYSATHHISANHQIVIEGDRAASGPNKATPPSHGLTDVIMVRSHHDVRHPNTRTSNEQDRITHGIGWHRLGWRRRHGHRCRGPVSR